MSNTHGAHGASGFSGYHGNGGSGSQNVRWHNGYQYVWSDEKQDFVRWVKLGRNNIPILYKDVLAGKTEKQCIADFQRKGAYAKRVSKERAKAAKKRKNPTRALIERDFKQLRKDEESEQQRCDVYDVRRRLVRAGYDDEQATNLANLYMRVYNDPPSGWRRDVWEYGPHYAFSLVLDELSDSPHTRSNIVNAFMSFGYNANKAQLLAQKFDDWRRNGMPNRYGARPKRVARHIPTSSAGGVGNNPPTGNTLDIRQKGPNYALEQAFKQRPTSEAEVKNLFLSYGYSDSEADDLTNIFVKRWGGLLKRSSGGTGGSGGSGGPIRNGGSSQTPSSSQSTPTSQNPTTQQPNASSTRTIPLLDALNSLPDLNTDAGRQAFEAKVKALKDQRTPEQINEDERRATDYWNQKRLYDDFVNNYKNNGRFIEDVKSVVFGGISREAIGADADPTVFPAGWLRGLTVDYTLESIKEASDKGEKLSEKKALERGLDKAEKRLCAMIKDRLYAHEDPNNRAIRQLLLPNNSPNSPNRQFARNCAWNVANVSDPEIEANLKAQATRAFDIIGQIADNIGIDLTRHPQLSQIKLVTIEDPKAAGYYVPSSNTVKLTLNGKEKNVQLCTMVHELAHAVEHAVPGLRLTAALFRDEISDGTVISRSFDDKGNEYGSTIPVPLSYAMRDFDGYDEFSEIFSSFAEWFVRNPKDACGRVREFYERFAKALVRRDRLNAMVSVGSVTPDEKNFVHEYERKLDAALSQNNIKVALSLYQQWLRDQRILLAMAKAGDNTTWQQRHMAYNRLLTQIEAMFRSNETPSGKELLKQIERLVR